MLALLLTKTYTATTLLSKTGLNQSLLVCNPLKSWVTYSGCESRSPSCADDVQNQGGAAA